MSYDDSETIYHLTAAGWVETEERYFGTVQGTPKPIPEDRVETWKRHETQASEWSRTYVNWTCEWVSPTISRADRDALQKEYPIPGHGNPVTIGEPL
jgi:hypothetical protein